MIVSRGDTACISCKGVVVVAAVVLFLAGPTPAQIQWAGEAVISLDANDLDVGDVTAWANKGVAGGSFVHRPIEHYPVTATPQTVTESVPGSSGKVIRQVNFGPTPNWYWDMRPMEWDLPAPPSVTGGESFTLEIWHSTTKTTAEGIFSMAIMDSTSDATDPEWANYRGGYPPTLYPNAVESAQFSGNESRVRISVGIPGPFLGTATVPANVWTLQTYVYDTGTIRSAASRAARSWTSTTTCSPCPSTTATAS